MNCQFLDADYQAPFVLMVLCGSSTMGELLDRKPSKLVSLTEIGDNGSGLNDLLHREYGKISQTETSYQRCISPGCAATFGVEEVLVACPKCGSLLDVVYDWDRLELPTSLQHFEQKWARRFDRHCFSGVWRFHELLPFVPVENCVTVGEGQDSSTVQQRGG